MPVVKYTAPEAPPTVTNKPGRPAKIIDLAYLCHDTNITLDAKREAHSVQNVLGEISSKDTHTSRLIRPDISTSKPHSLLTCNTARIIGVVEVLSARY